MKTNTERRMYDGILCYMCKYIEIHCTCHMRVNLCILLSVLETRILVMKIVLS